MPIVFSEHGAAATPDQVPWIHDFIYLTETAKLTPSLRPLGFKAHIPANDPLLALTPVEYLKHYRASNIDLINRTRTTNETLIRNASKLKMSEAFPAISSAPTVSFTSPENTTTTRPPLPARKSSTFHKTFMTKLRPLPFQYVWAVWHDNPSKSTPPANSTPDASPSAQTATSTFSTRLTLLAECVPDIGAFYRIYNNFPWESLRLKDTVHVFRAGVKPLWEDGENVDGGSWTLKVRRDDGRAIKTWEEICLLGCGNELQAAIASERDHVLGMSYSPRLYWAHITVWTKKGGNKRSVDLLERTILDRLSPELRPTSAGEYYYKKHSEHEGWKDAVGPAAAAAMART